MNRQARNLSLTAFAYCLAAFGQGVPYSSATLSLSSNNTQAVQIPANTPSTLLSFTVEGDSTGGNTFDVLTSDPGIVVSLIVPSGVEVTSANAASLGFTYTVVPNGTLSEIEIPSLLSMPGTHTVIQIPGGQPSGIYQVTANASTVNVPSGIVATYFSSSTVGVTGTTDAANYATGGTVILSGLAFDGSTPVTGATVTAAISTPASLSGQATVGNIQLVSTQSVSPTLSDYSYSATLTNAGPAVQLVTAEAQTANLPTGISALNDTLIFGNVSANASVPSSNTITIERNPSQSFDPTTLPWTVSTPGAPINISLTDSGTGFDAATGDGIYTGTFTPTSTGTYTALLSFTGTSLAGNTFSRMASTQFTVSQPLANFVSFADSQQSAGVTAVATVSVQTAGTYRLSMQLQANNQNTIWGVASASLSTGSQQVGVSFANSQLSELGVNGPYERINAVLTYVGDSGDLLADSNADAGPTAAYALSSVASAIYFAGTNSATGVVTGAGPTFDLLAVNMGVNSSSATNCSWSAVLTDLAGNQIDFESSGGSLAAGNNSVTLNFNGNLIAQEANGPYIVTKAGIHCGTGQAFASPLFQTQAFTASQFTSITPDFGIAVTSTPAGASPGSTFRFGVFATAIGPFSAAINLSVAGLPTGTTATFTVPTIPGFGPTTLVIATSSTTPAGSYPLTITGTSGTLSHNAAATLIVTPPPQVATPTFSPVAGTYTSGQTVAISTTTSGASIRYTTDGSAPSETAGILYSGPFTIVSATTVNAIAYAGGMADSAVASATYTISCISNLAGRGNPSGPQANLSWASQSNATDYAILRSSTDGGPYTQVGTTGLTAYRDANDGLVRGNIYYYVVQPLEGSTEICQSNQAAIAIP